MFTDCFYRKEVLTLNKEICYNFKICQFNHFVQDRFLLQDLGVFARPELALVLYLCSINPGLLD